MTRFIATAIAALALLPINPQSPQTCPEVPPGRTASDPPIKCLPD